jgi:hypothetical protein
MCAMLDCKIIERLSVVIFILLEQYLFGEIWICRRSTSVVKGLQCQNEFIETPYTTLFG